MGQFTPILIQAGCYGVAMVLVFCFLGILLKGFMFKYIKVRASFGRLVMVKIRGKLRDHFAVGKVEDDFLKFNYNKKERCISLGGSDYFYRCLAVNWIDLEEGKNSPSKTNFTAVSGFDAEKFSDLLTRALMRPSIEGNKEKLMIVILLIIAVICLLSAYLSYNSYKVSMAIATAKGVVVGSSSFI